MDSDVLERQELTGGGGGGIKDTEGGSIAVAAVASSAAAVAADGIDGYISQLDKDGNIQQGGCHSQTQYTHQSKRLREFRNLTPEFHSIS